MPGRIIAGMIAIILMTVVPLKIKGIREAERTENTIRSALESAFEEIKCSGTIEKKLIERLLKKISAAGMLCDVEITIGTILVGRNGRVIRCIYPGIGETEDVRGKLVTLSVIPLKESFGIKLSNILWNSYIPSERFIYGGYIN